jgi:RNA polymerase sigma-70 factor, ECF subfamily
MLSADELARLYDEHAQTLFGLLLSITRNEADTHDLLQELFTRLATRPGLFDNVRDERAFLLRLAHNSAIDLIRRRGTRERHHQNFGERVEELFASSPDPDVQAFRDALSAGLESLPAEQRAVLHLKLWQGLTFETIAATLDLPLNTAASRYRYGLDKLRERLRPLYDEIK